MGKLQTLPEKLAAAKLEGATAERCRLARVLLAHLERWQRYNAVPASEAVAVTSEEFLLLYLNGTLQGMQEEITTITADARRMAEQLSALNLPIVEQPSEDVRLTTLSAIGAWGRILETEHGRRLVGPEAIQRLCAAVAEVSSIYCASPLVKRHEIQGA